MKVLDSFGSPSLFAINCKQEVCGAHILASQHVKDQPEWDEFRKDVIQQLKLCQVDQPNSPPSTTTHRNLNASHAPSTFVNGHIGGQLQSQTRPQAHLCPA